MNPRAGLASSIRRQAREEAVDGAPRPRARASGRAPRGGRPRSPTPRLARRGGPPRARCHGRRTTRRRRGEAGAPPRGSYGGAPAAGDRPTAGGSGRSSSPHRPRRRRRSRPRGRAGPCRRGGAEDPWSDQGPARARDRRPKEQSMDVCGLAGEHLRDASSPHVRSLPENSANEAARIRMTCQLESEAIRSRLPSLGPPWSWDRCGRRAGTPPPPREVARLGQFNCRSASRSSVSWPAADPVEPELGVVCASPGDAALRRPRARASAS